TPNMYAYNLSFAGNQSNYAAALAITMAVITMAIAYAVQLNSMLSFAGNQSNYAAALAITMAVITMAIAYAVQLNSMKEQMK
ncbi:hypothetical protein KHP57_16370, partial [Algiphilus sp. NNCM1]|nr:hypothetical protein [Algiphilus acroporae]